MSPALKAAPFEMLKPEVVLEFAVLLFDRPAAARERDQIDQRCRGRQVQQIVLPLVGGGTFAEEPSVVAPARRGDAQRHERAVSGPTVPVPHVTDSHASSDADCPRAAAACVPGTPSTAHAASPRIATP